MVFADTLTGGAIAGTIGFILALLVCIGWTIAFGFAWWNDEHSYDRGMFVFMTCAGVGAIVLTVAVYIYSMWPFSYEYHHWVDKSGRVQEIEKRLVPAGEGMQEKIVVRMEGEGGVYGITETRATLLKQGMNLHIRCKKAYDFGVNRGAHGWDCKYVSSDLDGGV